MNPQTLWQILLSAGIQSERLKTLAYDVYYQKPTAEGDASFAVEALAKPLGIEPRFAYAAFKLAAAAYQDGALGGDRKKVLEWLAHDYQHTRAWDATSQITKDFLAKVAHNVDVIKAAMAKQNPPPPSGGLKAPVHHHPAPAAAAVAAAPVAAGSKARVVLPHVEHERDLRPSLAFFIFGTLASFILSLRSSQLRLSAA